MTRPFATRVPDIVNASENCQLDYLARVSTLVHPLPVPEKLLRDPADEPVLGTALAGNADVICTRDADFHTEEVRRFSAARGIQILSDLELLRALRL